MRRKVENLFTGEFLKSVSRGINITKPQKLPISILFEILEGDTIGKIIEKVSSFTNLENKQYQAIGSLMDSQYQLITLRLV
jgi:non-canonical (house-cleaning) NTP pyrophosphatase